MEEKIEYLDKAGLRNVLSKFKTFVSNMLDSFVKKTGDTMTGDLTVKKSDATVRLENEFGSAFRLHTYGSAAGKGTFSIYDVKSARHPIRISEETGVVTLSNPLPIASGGTEAKTASDACSNLGAVKKSGDIMTGNLTIGEKVNPMIILKNDKSGVFRLQVDGSTEGNNKFGFYDANNKRWVLNVAESDGTLALYKPLPIASGGTGGNTAKAVRENLRSYRSLEDNVTGGASNDTNQFWKDKEPGWYAFSKSDQLKDQPGQYGWLYNGKSASDSSLIFQIFCMHRNSNNANQSGQLYTRSLNYNSSNDIQMPWVKYMVWSDVYPVGSLYITFRGAKSPASLFGGTWSKDPELYSLAATSNSAGVGIDLYTRTA